MTKSASPLLLALPVLALLGCSKPDIDFSRLRAGMTKEQVIGQVGNPSKLTVLDHAELFEYEAYDHYGAMRVNPRSQFVRFVNGRVESFGNKGDLDAGRIPSGGIGADPRAGAERRDAAPGAKAVAPPPAAFDLRTELEKLEGLKKDGLITETEFKELRQRILDKARAQ